MSSDMSEKQEQQRRLKHEADVVVVGAGIFGCAMAFAMAKQGRSVLLLEKSMKEPNRIVGELLQPGGVEALQKLGLAHCIEDIDGISVKGYEVIYYGEGVRIPYPVTESSAVNGAANGSVKKEGERPTGKSFHHGRFIAQLRKACASQPNITIVETEVTATITGSFSPQIVGVESRTTNPTTGQKELDRYFGKLTIIADGYASKFRKQYNNKAPIVKGKFYALELIDCPMPAPNHGIVILSDAPPVLLYQIGTHETRALIDVPEGLPSASPAQGGVRGHIEKVIIPRLPEKVRPCVREALSDGKIPRSMPNSFLPPTTQKEKGMVILGDAMNMRHPLTGGGMTVAFNDVVILSRLLSPEKIPDLGDAAAVQHAMKEFHWERKNLSSIINILSMALYSLFAADSYELKALQKGCFQYFKKGGECIDGPAGLLAGIIAQPMVLVYHFFSVAVLAIRLVIGEIIGGVLGLWKLPYALIQAILIFWRACVVIFPFIFSELQS
ncbi:squalene epoxidase-domain-containing protein [Xylogone sp. PMI_703]|nr:squalene epoxidase-domain-containing protein [Xylogone sp. PMI_703]